MLASFEPGYNPRDEGKDIGAGWSFVNKDQDTARKPINNEIDWQRCFAVWKAGVLLLYRHREDELVKYHTKISSLFRNSRDHSFVIIRLDLEVRSLYAKTPFRMDDIHEVNAMWMAQLTKPQNISSTSHLKRPNPDNSPPSFKGILSVSTGMAVHASSIPANTIEDMESAVSAEEDMQL